MGRQFCNPVAVAVKKRCVIIWLRTKHQQDLLVVETRLVLDSLIKAAVQRRLCAQLGANEDQTVKGAQKALLNAAQVSLQLGVDHTWMAGVYRHLIVGFFGQPFCKLPRKENISELGTGVCLERRVEIACHVDIVQVQLTGHVSY